MRQRPLRAPEGDGSRPVRTWLRRGLALATVAIGTAHASRATADSCSLDERNPKNLVVVETPESPCVDVYVGHPTCADAPAVVVTNTCQEVLLLPEEFQCDDGSPCVLKRGQEGYEYARRGERVDMSFVVERVIETEREPITIEVGFDVVSVPYDPPEGCAVGSPPGASSALLLALAAAYTARRGRRDRR